MSPKSDRVFPKRYQRCSSFCYNRFAVYLDKKEVFTSTEYC